VVAEVVFVDTAVEVTVVVADVVIEVDGVFTWHAAYTPSSSLYLETKVSSAFFVAMQEAPPVKSPKTHST
jgi:hypothetical protein